MKEIEELLDNFRLTVDRFGYHLMAKQYEDDILKAFADKDARIAELEALIEELKCCGNCKNYEFEKDVFKNKLFLCKKFGLRNPDYKCDKWEAK